MYHAKMGSLLSAADFSRLLSRLGLTVDDKTAMVIFCGVCAAVALIAVLLAVWAVRKKGGQRGGDSKAAAPGIPLKLEIYSGRCRNTSALLTLSDCLTIGSGAGCDIIFDNPEVAEENSRIKLADGQVYIEDLDSPQGTTLDGMRFQGRNKLRGGEVISIGPVAFCVSFPESTEAESQV